RTAVRKDVGCVGLEPLADQVVQEAAYRANGTPRRSAWANVGFQWTVSALAWWGRSIGGGSSFAQPGTSPQERRANARVVPSPFNPTTATGCLGNRCGRGSRGGGGSATPKCSAAVGAEKNWA